MQRIIVYSILGVMAAYVYTLQGRNYWTGYVSKMEENGCTIYSDLPYGELKPYMELYDSFKAYFERKYFSVNNKKLKIYLFYSQDTYEKYVSQFGKRAPITPYGFYLPGRAIMAFNSQSGLGTLTHEFAHHFIYSSGKKMPLWLEEGFSAFFEKFIGLKDENREMVLSFGYLSLDRIGEVFYYRKQAKLTLEPLFNTKEIIESIPWNFVLFAHREDKLSLLIENAAKYKDSMEIVEKTFREPLSVTEQRWNDWIDAIGSHPDIMDMIPIEQSRIYTKTELEKLDPPVKWDPSKERFVYDPEKMKEMIATKARK